MLYTQNTAINRSKSARKDANRRAKVLDNSNWLVLYLEPSDVMFWQNGWLSFPNGATPMFGTELSDPRNHTVDHIRTVIQYNSIKSSAICAWNKQGYTRFKKWGIPKKDRLSLEERVYFTKPRSQYGHQVTSLLPHLERSFWGQLWCPRVLSFYDSDRQAYLIALAVFDPNRDFL